MLHRVILSITTVYFLLGNILLPQGDFSTIAQLPAMYQHCKTAEDPDINIADFITEHLLNIEEDDADEKDEHELPHNPVSFQTNNNYFVYNIPEVPLLVLQLIRSVTINNVCYRNPYFSRLGQNEIFQPPRA
jgi:hypothetical protein